MRRRHDSFAPWGFGHAFRIFPGRCPALSNCVPLALNTSGGLWPPENVGFTNDFTNQTVAEKTPTGTPNEDCCDETAYRVDLGLRLRWCDTMKMRELLKRLHRDGWIIDRSRGSHRQFRHPTKSGTVTVSGHPSDDIHPKTLKSVLRQADLEE